MKTWLVALGWTSAVVVLVLGIVVSAQLWSSPENEPIRATDAGIRAWRRQSDPLQLLSVMERYDGGYGILVDASVARWGFERPAELDAWAAALTGRQRELVACLLAWSFRELADDRDAFLAAHAGHASGCCSRIRSHLEQASVADDDRCSATIREERTGP